MSSPEPFRPINIAEVRDRRLRELKSVIEGAWLDFRPRGDDIALLITERSSLSEITFYLMTDTWEPADDAVLVDFAEYIKHLKTPEIDNYEVSVVRNPDDLPQVSLRRT